MRFKEFKAQPSQFRAKTSVLLICLITAPLLVANFILEGQIQNSSFLILDGIRLKKEFVHISYHSLFSFSLFQETVGSREVDKYMYQGAPLFDRYFEWCHDNIDFVVENRKPKTNLAAEINLLDTVEKLFAENYCENYLKEAYGYRCDSVLLNTGLEKTTVHLVERVRLLLDEFKKSSLDFEASKSMARRAEYKEIGKHRRPAGLTF